MNNILTIDSVSKHYGNFTALNDVSINIQEGSIFGLLGPNGVGKTTLIKGLLSLMRVVENVSSPTFSIINEYSTDKNEIIYHMDLYRIEDISELDNIGFFEYLESGKTCLIEWGEMIEELIDSEYNKFTITKDDNLRIIEKNR